MRWAAVLITALTLQAQSSEPHIRAAVEALQNGKAALAKKQFESAASLFQKAIEIEPTFTEAREALIHVELAAAHRMEAAKGITQLLEIEPSDAKNRVLLGEILLEEQQPERALAQFSAALTTDPNDADVLSGFATAATRMGMTDRAKEALERGRKRFPSDPRFQLPSKQNN
jgi:tetratricopeptide (TPR) repeat protein